MIDVSNSELEALINEWIHSERDRQLLKRRLIDGIIFEDLAYEFDLSVRHTKTLSTKIRKSYSKKLSKSRIMCYNNCSGVASFLRYSCQSIHYSLLQPESAYFLNTTNWSVNRSFFDVKKYH